MRKAKLFASIVGIVSLVGLLITASVSAEALKATRNQRRAIPTVEIISPLDGAVVTESPVTVTGTVFPRGAKVTVNGVAATKGKKGTFSAQVELAEGENIITAVAKLGKGKKRAEDTVTVTLRAEPPLTVEITSPEDGAELTESPVTVTGTVSDPEATVEVNGVAADVAADGSFSAEVELVEGENVIEAVATLDATEASDSITVTLTTEPPPEPEP